MTNSESPKVIIVIPARFASVRFSGKPLAEILGKPMIQYVLEGARQAKHAAQVLVATEDERIKKAVEGAGGEAVMTRADHRTGTDRIAGGGGHGPAGLFFYVQGD